jgi:hypothetical protein
MKPYVIAIVWKGVSVSVPASGEYFISLAKLCDEAPQAIAFYPGVVVQ